jgi:hypothetical protein
MTTVPMLELIVFYATFDPIDEVNASTKHNLCQGSNHYGMVLFL